MSFEYAAAVHVIQATTTAMFWLRNRIDVAGRFLGGLKDNGQLELWWAALYCCWLDTEKAQRVRVVQAEQMKGWRR